MSGTTSLSAQGFDLLGQREAKRNTAYRDSRGIWTIGIGHHDDTICEGLCWSPEKVDQVFGDDVDTAYREALHAYPWIAMLNEPRAAVIVEMVFQMGFGKVQEFVTLLGFMRDQRWPQAAADMLATAWARETPERVRRLSRQVETGDWQIAP